MKVECSHWAVFEQKKFGPGFVFPWHLLLDTLARRAVQNGRRSMLGDDILSPVKLATAAAAERFLDSTALQTVPSTRPETFMSLWSSSAGPSRSWRQTRCCRAVPLASGGSEQAVSVKGNFLVRFGAFLVTERANDYPVPRRQPDRS